jgi:hypothetical protein
MPSAKTFSPKETAVIVGSAIISGFADGTYIDAERTSDSFTMSSGADGQVTRVASADKSGTITLTLAQSSPSNDVLSAIALNDENTGTGVVPIAIKDNSGTTTLVAAEGWIRKPANVSFSKEIETREWVIDCAEVEFFVGGNNDASIL